MILRVGGATSPSGRRNMVKVTMGRFKPFELSTKRDVIPLGRVLDKKGFSSVILISNYYRVLRAPWIAFLIAVAIRSSKPFGTCGATGSEMVLFDSHSAIGN